MATVRHALVMVTPDDPAYENKPSDWNADHLVTLTPADVAGLVPIIPGMDGLDGEDGASIPGTPGPAGAAGSQGPQGFAGRDGVDGQDGNDGPPGVAGANGAQGIQGIQGLQGPPGFDGQDGVDGADGAPGPAGPQGPAGTQSVTTTMFIGEHEFNEPDIIPGPTGAQGPAGSGSGGAFTAFTKDLGAARRSGTFDITGLSGLTAGKFVDIVQTMDAIASKGNARDEYEMDPITLTGYVVDAATIRALWACAGGQNVAVGTYAFAYQVSG